ncbi:UNVERIFIED_CONTAM: hypothetical protein FKN15_020298 [Acipenser sinensis]
MILLLTTNTFATGIWGKENNSIGIQYNEWHTSPLPAYSTLTIPEHFVSEKCGENLCSYPERPGDSHDHHMNDSLSADLKIKCYDINFEKKKKIRLFQFLFEMLEDPKMTHCISWVQPPSGMFQFSSQNKDKFAEMWGVRKGNRKTMTYQKMSRALRNYARTGEITKVKRKLTYQFNLLILKSLRRDSRII